MYFQLVAERIDGEWTRVWEYMGPVYSWVDEGLAYLDDQGLPQIVYTQELTEHDRIVQPD